jgi:hypothetical protein
MRLLNAETFEFKEFFPPEVPSYAILSHTWEDDEVLFSHMAADQAAAQRMPTFRKIRYTCEQALRDGPRYVWIDTCCIDKTSSAELSEAINSMFEWYAQSTVCYAFISEPLVMSLDLDAGIHNFEKCRWFTRGWTLQELLAPRKVVFFDHAWRRIGTRSSASSLISRFTGVEEDILTGKAPISSACVGKRMSWASRRRTTRIEDMAYCLLGLFDIHLPILYGEGAKAFIRLQEEILKATVDMTMFAWKAASDSPRFRDIFARSPAEFAHCHNLVTELSQFDFSRTIDVTSNRLSIPGIELYKAIGDPECDVLPVRCHHNAHVYGRRVHELGIAVQHTMRGWVRARPSLLFEVDMDRYLDSVTPSFDAMKVTSLDLDRLIVAEKQSYVTVTRKVRSGNITSGFTTVHPAALWDRKAEAFRVLGITNFTSILGFYVAANEKGGGVAVFHVLLQYRKRKGRLKIRVEVMDSQANTIMQLKLPEEVLLKSIMDTSELVEVGNLRRHDSHSLDLPLKQGTVRVSARLEAEGNSADHTNLSFSLTLEEITPKK